MPVVSRVQQKVQLTVKEPIGRRLHRSGTARSACTGSAGWYALVAALFLGFRCLPFLCHGPVQTYSLRCLRNREQDSLS